MAEENKVEILKKVRQTGGNVKGACTRAIFEYLRMAAEEKKIKEIKEKLKFYGYSLDPEKISPVRMYPLDFELAILFVLQEVLGWQEKEIKELGRNVPKLSFIVKFFIRYLVNLELGYKSSPVYWRSHFDIGQTETPEFNLKDKYLVLILKNFDLHPIYCVFLTGYFETMAKFILNREKVECFEEECTFKGFPYHKFIIKWD